MENKLDVITKKLYVEGVEKATVKAEQIIAEAQKEAERLIAQAGVEAKEIENQAKTDAENLKKKARSEMELSARQAVTALKQEITDLLSGKVAEGLSKSVFNNDSFVQEMMGQIIKKWDVTSGNIDLDVILSDDEKDQFKQYVAQKYKEYLDAGLEIKGGGVAGSFVVAPKDGGYRVSFSEELFETFFNQYIRSFTKELLYK